MRKSPLNLQVYGIEFFSFKTDAEFSGAYDIENAVCNAQKKHLVSQENELNHRVSLAVSIKPKAKGAFPYVVQAEIVGFFDIDADFYEKDRGKIADVNGSSILYGALREYIFMVTSHGRFGPVMLPTANFNEAPPKRQKAIK